MLTVNPQVADHSESFQEELGIGYDEQEDERGDINYRSQEIGPVERQSSQTMLAIRDKIAEDMWLQYYLYLARHS